MKIASTSRSKSRVLAENPTRSGAEANQKVLEHEVKRNSALHCKTFTSKVLSFRKTIASQTKVSKSKHSSSNLNLSSKFMDNSNYNDELSKARTRIKCKWLCSDENCDSDSLEIKTQNFTEVFKALKSAYS